MKKQTGAATLIITVILLVAATLIMIYAAQYDRLQQKSASNQYNANQAFEAAEAGLEFGIAYLNQNVSIITANPSGGFINYGSSDNNITNVSLANNSQFSVVYTNPIQSNYQLMQITSTGTGLDGTSTRVVRQLVYQQPNLFGYSVSSLGSVTLVGGSTLTNTVNNSNIITGGSLTLNNGAVTYTSSGQTSSQGNIGSDIQQNVASYQNMSESSFFQSIFGVSETTEQSAVQAAGNYYNNAGPDYSWTLNGQQGKTIWINQTNGTTVNIGQGVTIGSPSNPVTIIVEGDLYVANGVTIYGFIYASGPVNGFYLAGGAKIYGGVASAGAMNISNGVQLQYDQFPTIAGSSSAGTFAKVPGSWKDF